VNLNAHAAAANTRAPAATARRTTTPRLIRNSTPGLVIAPQASIGTIFAATCKNTIRGAQQVSSLARARALHMRPYALVEAGDAKAIDVYLRKQNPQRALEDCLRE
jgi:hypothetical protein